MLTRHLTLLLTLTAFSFSAAAQNGGYSLFRSFTVADGLPSNHIYTCLEDNKGFLWVATDAGIARFDGKRFQTFTTKDGLPDDDVLDVVKENSGRIWVNCFKQSPAYFDEVQNRFINAKQDTNLAKVKGSGTIYLIALPDGGVMYWNGYGSFFFKEGRLTILSYLKKDYGAALVVQKYNESDFIAFANGSKNTNPSIGYISNDTFKDTLSLKTVIREKDINVVIDDGKLYLTNFNDGKYYVFSSFKANPLHCKMDSVSIKEPVFWRGFTDSYFNIISQRGKIYVFDKQTLKPLFELCGNYAPTSLYNDSKKNVWISTVDKGLLLYKKKYIETFPTPDNFNNTHFLSLAQKPNGAIFAGNFYGQVVETDGKYFIVHNLPSGNSNSWQRKIIILQNKVFTFSEGGTFIDFSNSVMKLFANNSYAKTAAIFNDSTIIEGRLGGLSELNILTGERKLLPTFSKRTTCIGVALSNIIYHGSTDGLYKFDYNRKKDDSLSKKHPLLGERITAVSKSADNYVWVATASKGVLALSNDNVVKIFSTENGIISNSIKCITTGKPGEIWVGTNNGISIIRYINTPNNFTYQNLTINDGLSSNIINEMLYSNDTVYCATGNGICAIPANISLPRFDIPVRLTAVVINNRDTIISDNYLLKYNQNNIELHFAGIELGGHFNYFQYRIDADSWQKLEANTLTLQLSSGKHAVEIRAIDVNGNAGKQPLLVSFNITTPFWKATWFWILLFLLSGGSISWILRKREMAKREASMQDMLNQKKLTELELQALKSQINPHFIFNCLNSIKLLSHQQQHQEAEKYLDRFAALLRSAMEQSSLQQITLHEEIHFLENYLSLEKLRFPDKLSYSIEIDKSLHPQGLLIPSMLLQPYVENAVKHGIAPLKNRQGLVQVRFYQKDNTLIAEVQDNGNGIEKHNRITEGTGIGMANTARRSSLYNIETKLVDLKKVGANLKGTLVQLTMPLIIKT